MTRVRPEWIDHNGHMNVAYYVVAFDEATDAIYEHWGLGMKYPEKSGCSVFTLGMNVDYLAELFIDDAVRVTTQLVDTSDKCIHYFHQMLHGDSGQLIATNECLCMNVNLDTRKSQPFADDILAILATARTDAPAPGGFGRKLRIRR
ncbi:MAG: thioesterase family protein [Woeseiaceae bacterium]